jgi:hypothetical protein
MSDLERLGGAARSDLAVAPRLMVAQVKVRGRRRRNRNRAAVTGSTAAVMAAVVSTGVLAVSRREETTAAGRTNGVVGPPSTLPVRPLPTADRRTWPQAGFSGRLSVEDGCVYLLQGDLRAPRRTGGTAPGLRALVIWRAGHRLVEKPDGPVVVAPDGTELPTDGSPVQVGGGIVPSAVLDQVEVRSLPRDCITAQLALVSGPFDPPPPPTAPDLALPSWPPPESPPTTKTAPMPPVTSP